MELGDVERVDARERVVVEVERQDAEQHHDAADQRVEEELDRRVEPVGAAPDADEEVHRHQHHFPEQEEQQEVQRHERAEHPGLQHEQEDVVLLHPLGDRRPRRQHGNRPHHRRQQDEQHAEAVDAEEVLGTHRRDPRRALDELEVGVRRVVPEPERHGNHEADAGDDVGDPADRALVPLVHQQQDQRAGERREEDDRKVVIHRRVTAAPAWFDRLTMSAHPELVEGRPRR